jgi:hypothetical protein
LANTLRERLEKFRGALRELDSSVDELYAQGWFNDRERERIERFIDQEVKRLERAGVLNGNGVAPKA